MREYEKRLPISHEHYNNIEVYITYNKGDNYRTRRGYYIHVQPIEVVTRNCYEYVNAVPQEGYRFFAQSVTRKSAKALNEVIENLERYTQPILDKVTENLGIDRVMFN